MDAPNDFEGRALVHDITLVGARYQGGKVTGFNGCRMNPNLSLRSLWLDLTSYDPAGGQSFERINMITNTPLSTLASVHGLCCYNVRVIDQGLKQP